MRVDPYLLFHGRCTEALDFHRRSRSGMVADRFGVPWTVVGPPCVAHR